MQGLVWEINFVTYSDIRIPFTHYLSLFLCVPISSRHRDVSEALRRRNVELERELRSSLEGEQRVEEELRMTWQHVRLVEEQICNELDELEAEAVDHAMESRAQITLLMEKLFASEKLLQSLSLNNLSHSIMSSHWIIYLYHCSSMRVMQIYEHIYIL